MTRIEMFCYILDQQRLFNLRNKMRFMVAVTVPWTRRTQAQRKLCLQQESATRFFFSPGKLESLLVDNKADDIDADVIRHCIITSRLIPISAVMGGQHENSIGDD